MKDYLDFRKKTVLVTGSTRGIGLAVAELFAEQGASVIINGRSREDTQRVEHGFREKGHDVRGIAADMGVRSEASAVIDEIEKHFGGLDALVNCAGELSEGSFDAIDESDWDASIKNNLTSAFNVCSEGAKLMKKRKSGVIITMTSPSAVYGTASERFGASTIGLPYIAAKGGIFSLTRGLSRELGAWGIRVNAVMPALIPTELRERNVDQSSMERAAGTSALHRFGSPEEVAKVCLFLASDLASYVTGEVIALGGYIKPGIDL